MPTLSRVVALLGCVGYALACSGSIKKNSPVLRTLKNVYGIEFVDTMLIGSNTSYNANGFIRKPGDLDCDFEKPSECAWSNYRSKGTDERDNVDYFLFKKTDRKKFSGLNPGPTPPLGSQFVLAGDRSSAPSDAVWYSTPIRCQDFGKLSFHYNIYGNAKIQVLALKPGTDPLQDSTVLNINCPRFPPAATRRRKDGNRCIANIPPSKEPFQLAIRAHNLQNNFVVLDNIRYEGKLCQGADQSSSSGDKFGLGSAAAHRSGLTGQEIRSVDEVECGDFAGCRWGSAPGGDAKWAVHSARPNLQQWRRLTGSSTLPNPDYLVLKSEDGRADANFVTDPMPCQAGTGRFSLTYWVSQGAELELCAIDYESLRDVWCETVGRAGAGWRRVFQVPGPIQRPFFLSLEGRIPGSGGFVAVDDLAYDADIDSCGQNQEPDLDAGDLLSGSGLRSGPLSGGLTGETVEYPEDLNCGFDKEPVGGGRSEFLCQWGNNAGRGSGGNRATAQWKLVEGQVNADLLRETSGGGRAVPDGEFTATEFGSGGGLSLMHSDPMLCQRGQGTLIVSYWLSQGVELRVCPVDPSTGRSLNGNAACTLIARGPAQAKERSLPIPAQASTTLDKPFRLQFEAKSSGEGYAIMDDVSYDAELCRKQAVTVAPVPVPGRQDLERACVKLSCPVDSASRSGMCNFRSLPRLPGDPRFAPQSGPIGGPTSNVQVGRNYPGRFFIGTVIKNRRRFSGQVSASGDVAVLRSSPFKIPPGSTATFSFKHQRGIVDSKLWLCRNEFIRAIESRPMASQRRCQLVSGDDSNRPWELNSVSTFSTTLNPSDYRVYIVATYPEVTASTPAGFLLDDMTLTLPNGQNLC